MFYLNLRVVTKQKLIVDTERLPRRKTIKSQRKIAREERNKRTTKQS